jgi:hypothetical protein
MYAIARQGQLPRKDTSGLHFHQSDAGGMVLIEGPVPTAVVAKILAKAKSAGMRINT